MNFDHAGLSARAAARNGTLPDRLALRVHRALSWLERAELCSEDDDDSRYIFLWISLNAAYAGEIQRDANEPERDALKQFLSRLTSLDRANLLHELVWNKFSGPIRMLLDNKFVFQPFWDYQSGRMREREWRRRFEGAQRAAHAALGNSEKTDVVLDVLLQRLYTLRNQLVHGGATWKGSVNRDQIRDGCAILGDLTPRVIHLLIENPDEDWGEPLYPVVGGCP
ncbi:MAG: HEPN domain-containing protein [Gammaproteobacteria bacterium]|nr:HEPN domain-containing protein [Gammaproteobacteria bacterium]